MKCRASHYQERTCVAPGILSSAGSSLFSGYHVNEQSNEPPQYVYLPILITIPITNNFSWAILSRSKMDRFVTTRHLCIIGNSIHLAVATLCKRIRVQTSGVRPLGNGHVRIPVQPMGQTPPHCRCCWKILRADKPGDRSDAPPTDRRGRLSRLPWDGFWH
jgi:hypothetical protein